MRHVKDPDFDELLQALPKQAQELAAKNFALLKNDPKHPSLHFKRIHGELWSARIGHKYRALAIEGDGKFQWIWIGSHAEYDRLTR